MKIYSTFSILVLSLTFTFAQQNVMPRINSKCVAISEINAAPLQARPVIYRSHETELVSNAALRTMAPANDDQCTAQSVNPNGTCVAGTTVAANDSWSGEVGCATSGNATSHEDVFYSFVATGTQLTASITAGAGWTGNIEFLIYQTPSCTIGPFTLVGTGTCGASPLAITTNGLVVGNTYYCSISNTGAGANGAFTFCPTTATPACTVTSCASPDVVAFTTGTQTCQTDCNTGAASGPDFAGNNCYDFPTETYWYQITTTATSATMNISITSAALTNPYFSVFTTSNCSTFSSINCTQGAAGAVSATVTVAASTTYYIAVSDLGGLDGSFTFCATVNNDNSACNKTDALTVSSTSMGSPLAGPYKSGEVVSFCYNITNFTQFNCNYLEGIVPSFGNGWDPTSFTAQGAPVTITTPLVAAGVIQTVNPNPGTNACAGTAAGAWSWFPAGAVTYNNINNPAIPNGTAMGAGWYFLSSYSPQTGLCTGDPTDPDNSYGDSDYPSCLNNTLDWQVCFKLTAMINNTAACTAGNTDCSVTIKTYADGELGAWNSVGCTSDIATPSPSTVLFCCTPPPVSAGSDITNCSAVAGTIGAAATAGFTYSWSPATGLSSATAANPTVTLTNATTTATTNSYIVTITETATGCTNTDTVIVTVNPTATVTATVSPVSQAICSGSTPTITLTSGVAGTSFAWTVSQTNVSGATAASGTSISEALSTTTSASGTAVYTITPTANSCAGTPLNVTITVNPIPNVTATPASQTFCSGTTTGIALTGSVASTAFNWTVVQTNVSGASASSGTTIAQALTATSTIAGTAVYTITPSANGCSGTPVSVTITVNPIDNPAFNYSSSTYCVTGPDPSANITGAATGTFSSAVGLVFLDNTTGLIDLGASTLATYTVTFLTNGTCPSSATFSVTITNSPIATFSYSAPYCQYATNPLPTFPVGASAGVFSSSVGLTFVSTNTGQINLTTSTPGTYMVYNNITAAGGCSAAVDSNTVTIIAAPIVGITANPNDTVCAGTAITLSGTGANTYTWNNGITDATLFTPGASLVYTVTGTNTATTCTDTASISIVVNNLPTVVANSTSAAVCAGNAITLTGSGATSYTWDNAVVDGVAFNPAGTLTYTVTGTDANGCVDTDLITVTVNNLPTVVANALDTTICAGLTANVSGSGASSYAWNNGVTDGVNFTPVTSMFYTVTGTDLNGCVNIDSIEIVINTLPTVTATASSILVCPGGSDTLTGGGALTYTWDNGVLDGVSFNPVSTLTYTVTGTDANGCQDTAMITITAVNNLNVTALATDTMLCAGDAVTLSGSGATTYTWDNGVVDGVAFTPGATTQYTVTGNTNGCLATDTISVYVNTLPTVSASASVLVICQGGAVTLTGSGASNYAWNNSVVDAVAFNPTGTLTYTVTGTDGNGCQDTAMIAVTVNNNPTVIANTTATSVCPGGSVTLSGGGAVSYTWNNGVVDAVAFNPAGTLTYTVTGTDANSCQDTAMITVTVNSNPTVTANATAGAVCPGGAVTLTGGGASTYTWDNGVTDSFAFNPAGTLTYTVTGTDVNGCVNTAATTVTVNLNPTVTASASTNTICAGQSVTLTGGGASTYTWNNGAVDAVAFSPAGTLTYTVTGTDGNGCQDTAMISVTVNNNPTVTANTTATSVCPGGSVTLSGGGAVSYTWNNGIVDAVAFNPAGTLTYTVTGTDANSCQDTAMITITVNNNPTVTANATAAAVCTGGAVTLTGGGASTYTWDNGVTDSFAFNPAGTLTYTVTGTDVNGCVNTATTTVTVNLLPTVTASASTNTICAGQSVTLTGGGASTYTWDNGAVNAVAFNPAGTVTYTVTGTDVNGCTDTATTTVNVNLLPTVTANATSLAICTGQSVTLTGGGANTYSWNNGVVDAVAFNPTGTLTYTVTGTTTATGCTNTATVTVTVNTIPTVTANASTTTICSGQPVTLTGGGASTYVWDNGVVNGVVFNPTGTLTYTVTGTSAAGCVNTASVTVTVGALASLTNVGNTVNAICGSNGSVNSVTPNSGLAFNWTNAAGTSVATTADLNNATPGAYTLTVSNIGGSCPQAYNYTIADQNTVVASFTATPISGTAPVEVTFTNQSQNALNYSWNFADGNTSTSTSPVNEYTVSGTYNVVLTATGTGTCVDYDTLLITVVDSIIPMSYPNVFSPNSDNINDLFYVRGSQLVGLNVKIFDRWGLKIYEYDGVLGSWDGRTSAGNAAPTGVYYFLLDGTFKDGSKIPDDKNKGYVTLVR